MNNSTGDNLGQRDTAQSETKPAIRRTQENVPSEKYRGLVFSTKGRSSRLTFWVHHLIMLLLITFIITLLARGGYFSLSSRPLSLDDVPFIIKETSLSIVTFSAQITELIFMRGRYFFSIEFEGIAYVLLMAGIYSLILTIRRLHDFGVSGWLSLLICIPWVGFIPLIIFGCIPSDKCPNEYGTEPDVVDF